MCLSCRSSPTVRSFNHWAQSTPPVAERSSNAPPFSSAAANACVIKALQALSTNVECRGQVLHSHISADVILQDLTLRLLALAPTSPGAGS